MTLESMLLIGCIFGNDKSCLTSAQAYYQVTEWPRHVQKYVEERQSLSQTILLMGVIHNKKATAGLTENIAASVDFTTGSGYWELRWTYGF